MMITKSFSNRKLAISGSGFVLLGFSGLCDYIENAWPIDFDE